MVIPLEKQGHVKDLLEEASDVVPTVDTHKLRLVELSSYKIQRIIPPGTSLDVLVQQPPKSYRIEVSLIIQLLCRHSNIKALDLFLKMIATYIFYILNLNCLHV